MVVLIFFSRRQFLSWGLVADVDRRGFHLHFRVGGQSDESRHHSLSNQRLIHPLHQQLSGLDRAIRDVTEVGGALGQERATRRRQIRRERERNKTKKKNKRRRERGEGAGGGGKKVHKKKNKKTEESDKQ